MMRWSIAVCWTLVILAAFFFEGISSKGGRGGARGAARGSARGSTRRSKPSTHYGSLRVAAAAAGGAAAGASVAAAARMRSAGGGSPDHAGIQSGNSTGEGSYNYRAWTSGAQPWHFAYLPACLFCLASIFSL